MIKINYNSKLPLSMQFKTMHCCKCGNKLEKKVLSSITTKQDSPLSRPLLNIGRNTHQLLTFTKVQNFSYLYQCKECKYLISYEHQNIIWKYQKKNKKLILSESEIDSLDVSFRA